MKQEMSSHIWKHGLLSVGLGVVLSGLAIWPLAGPVLGTATHDERKETFEYYQDGKTGRGRRRVLVLDLGDGVKMEFVRVPAGTFLMVAGGRTGPSRGRGAAFCRAHA